MNIIVHSHHHMHSAAIITIINSHIFNCSVRCFISYSHVRWLWKPPLFHRRRQLNNIILQQVCGLIRRPLHYLTLIWSIDLAFSAKGKQNVRQTELMQIAGAQNKPPNALMTGWRTLMWRWQIQTDSNGEYSPWLYSHREGGGRRGV